MALITFVGCGRIGFDHGDAARGDAARGDASVTLGPFGAATPISELNAGFTDDPTLSSDELEIIFNSNRSGGVGDCDLWTSTRASISAAWTAPINLTSLNTPNCDSSPLITDGDLVLRFATNPAGNLDFDLFESPRSAIGVAWQPPQVITELDTAVSEFAPTSTADNLVMVFSILSGLDDLIVVTRADTQQPWSGRTPISELNVGRERSAHLSADGLALWFISDRPGGMGGDDVWFAIRATRADPFDQPVPLNELNTSENEDDPWVSEDRRRIYFARGPVTGSPRLFAATR